MPEFFINWAESTWRILLESSFLFLIGLILAGLIWLFINEKNISRYLSGKGLTGVFKAALVGIPLPLCSCSVLPVAAQLRKSGAGKGAISAFLIATPETGIDSVMLTYSLTDPVLTIARPVTAFITAVAAGTVELPLQENDNPENTTNDISCHDDCCEAKVTAVSSDDGIFTKILRGVKYSFEVLLKDLSPYLLAGFILAGLVGVILGGDLVNLPPSLTHGWLGYLGAIVIGLPLYICASSSTPLAAVLLAGGFTPGAILVFLLVGPATNLTSLVVLKKILGGRATMRYIIVIVICSVLAGLALDQVYGLLNISTHYQNLETTQTFNWFEFVSAVILGLFVLYYSVRWLLGKFR